MTRALVFRFLVSAMLCLWAAPVWAQACDALAEPRGRAAALGDAIGILERSFAAVESVQPAQSEYVEREAQQALARKDRQRFDAVYNSPFYHPHQLRKHLKSYKDSLEAARDANSVADQIVALSGALTRYGDLLLAFEDYLGFDRGRTPARLDATAIERIRFALPWAQGRALLTLQCAARQMREP